MCLYNDKFFFNDSLGYIDPMVPNRAKVRNKPKLAPIEQILIKRQSIDRRNTHLKVGYSHLNMGFCCFELMYNYWCQYQSIFLNRNRSRPMYRRFIILYEPWNVSSDRVQKWLWEWIVKEKSFSKSKNVSLSPRKFIHPFSLSLSLSLSHTLSLSNWLHFETRPVSPTEK